MIVETHTNYSNTSIDSYSNVGEQADSDANLMNVRNMLRYKIVNNKNEAMGNIKDIVLSVKNGNISYVILSFGSFLGMREKLMAIPLSILKVDVERKRFLIDMERAKLDNPLIFDNDNWPDMTSSLWLSRVHRFFRFDQKPGGAAL